MRNKGYRTVTIGSGMPSGQLGSDMNALQTCETEEQKNDEIIQKYIT